MLVLVYLSCSSRACVLHTAMFIYDFFKKCFYRGPQFGSMESFISTLQRFTVYIFGRISVLVLDHQMCFRVKGLNCFAEISSIYAILWCCERCQEKTERVRGVTRFVFMAQLVFCWSSLLAPGRPVFILLIYIKCSPTIV